MGIILKAEFYSLPKNQQKQFIIATYLQAKSDLSDISGLEKVSMVHQSPLIKKQTFSNATDFVRNKYFFGWSFRSKFSCFLATFLLLSNPVDNSAAMSHSTIEGEDNTAKYADYRETPGLDSGGFLLKNSYRNCFSFKFVTIVWKFNEFSGNFWICFSRTVKRQSLGNMRDFINCIWLTESPWKLTNMVNNELWKKVGRISDKKDFSNT